MAHLRRLQTLHLGKVFKKSERLSGMILLPRLSLGKEMNCVVS